MFIVPVARHSRPYARLLDDSIERFFASTGSETTAARNPALDVVESDVAYTVKLDIPGVAKEDVKVAIDGRQVTVQAQAAKTEAPGEGERLIYRERSVSAYARSFKLAAEVDQAESGAKLENGVLTLTLSKRSPRSAAQLAVN